MSFTTEIQPAPAPATPPSVIEPMGSEQIGRTFNVAGMAPGCAQVTVTVKDSGGSPIGGTPKNVAVGANGYYSTPIMLGMDFAGVTVNVVCTAIGGLGTSVSGIDVVQNPPITEFARTTSIVAGSLKTLSFSVTYTNHTGSDQSVVLVLYGYVGANLLKFSPHSFTSNPPKTQTYTYSCIDPGIYVAQVTFVDGQNNVSSRRFTYVV